jgi:2-C-methyl-D-erythritol 2,4-cyclodiphosphate synthase
MRIGFGNDIHRLENGRPLVIGGVRIPADFGAVGHSDADVLLHAVTDAILGALAVGDIGSHFSDQDERWKDADSLVFLREAVRLMRLNGYQIGNVDSTISLEQPKLRDYKKLMRENLVKELSVAENCISIKAKTGEGLDAIGKGRAIKAEVVILLKQTG